jgi:lipid-A-disaccharide synthase-like uncharacterized protein
MEYYNDYFTLTNCNHKCCTVYLMKKVWLQKSTNTVTAFDVTNVEYKYAAIMSRYSLQRNFTYRKLVQMAFIATRTKSSLSLIFWPVLVISVDRCSLSVLVYIIQETVIMFQHLNKSLCRMLDKSQVSI